MAEKCEACQNDFAEKAEKISCSGKCKLFFHLACTGLPNTNTRKKNWVCPACKKSVSNIPSESSNNDLLKRIEELKKDSESYKSEVMKKLEEFQQSLEFTTEIVTDFKNSNEKLHAELKSIKEQNEKLLEENKSLRTQISDMKSELVDLQQYSRRLNVEISNLPEEQNENILQVSENIMKSLDINLSESITTVHRVPTLKKDKIKPIIMQFNTIKAKSDFIKAAKEKRITAEAVNKQFDKIPVYFNDHLCPELKSLLYHCKNFKREKNFKFCWNKGGKIFLRKSEGSKIYRVKSIPDLENVPTE